MNQLDPANKLLDEVLAPGSTPGSEAPPTAPFDVFIARLAKSEALRLAKKNDPALALVKQAREMEIVQQSPMLLVLTYDRQFKITGDPEVYVQLFNDPAAASAKAAIEGFVKGRMVEDKQLSVAEMAKAEPFIVLANVDALLEKGRQFQQQAAKGGINQSDQKKLLEQGGKSIADAREGLKQLLTRKDLTPPMVAEAKLKLGAAEYQLGNRAEAVASWVDLASTMPQEKMAEAAAINAFLVARKLWEENQKHPAAIKLFGDAQQALLNKFPHARIGEDPVALHWHTRAGFLRQTGELQYAIDAFTKFVELNPDHTLVPDALYQVLLAEHELYRAAPLKERPRYADGVINAAKRALDALAKAAASAESERAQTLKYQQGDAVLRQAEVLSEGSGKHAEAQALLKDYDERFGAFPDLVRAKRELLVNILVGFGQVAEARSELEKFVQQFPDQGGAMMSQVLDAINRQAEELARLGQAEEAKQRANVGVDFAQFLLTWAKQQPEYKDPKKQMPFQTMLARQFMTAGRSQEALKIYDQLAATETGQTNLQVLHGQAKTLFRLGRFEDALPVVNTILRLAPDKTAAEVWDSWMMRMTILDKQVDQYNAPGEKHDPAKAKKTSTLIFTTVEKLKQFDRELGGPPYKDELTRLQNKHFPK